MTQLAYLGSNLINVVDLADLLGVEVCQILHYASNSTSSYVLIRQPKKNGGYREIYSPIEGLKAIQRAILNQILRKVQLPNYLQGSVVGRDYLSNARLHTAKATLIKEDIKDFFPSIQSGEVNLIWVDFFGFSKEVSEILTLLTTFNGFLPQGAPTSSDIANIIFFDLEPTLYGELKRMGLEYSRYVDDISISCDRVLKPDEVKNVQKRLFNMLGKKGLCPKKEKSEVHRNTRRMEVHNINVNTSRPTRAKRDRNNMRAAVHNCEISRHKVGSDNLEFIKLFNQTYGKLIELERMHPQEARKLLNRLDKIKPKI
jgi:hypothetical protein